MPSIVLCVVLWGTLSFFKHSLTRGRYAWRIISVRGEWGKGWEGKHVPWGGLPPVSLPGAYDALEVSSIVAKGSRRGVLRSDYTYI